MNIRTDFTVSQEQADTLNARIAWEKSVHKISEAIHAHGIRSEKAEKAEKDSNDLYIAYQQEGK